MKVDLIVIGGGPAGLAAAATAAGDGLRVALVDEGLRLGGRLLGQVHEQPHATGGDTYWNGPRVAAELERAAQDAMVNLYPNTTAWGIFPSWQVALHGTGPKEIEADYLLLATGALQRPLPLPGWTLPGVLMVGAAQMMINCHRVLPGRRALLVGVDPLSLITAQQMVQLGMEVVGVVLPPPGPLAGEYGDPRSVVRELIRLSSWAPSASIRLGRRLLQGAAAASMVARFYPRGGISVSDVPVMARRAVVELRGDNEVRVAVLADVNADGGVEMATAQEVDVDVVCTSGGLSPLTECAALAGCELAYLPGLGGYVPLLGPNLETTVERVFVAGSGGGVEAAQVAILQGQLVGHAVARAAGRLDEGRADRLMEGLRQKLENTRQEALSFYAGVAEARAQMSELWARRAAGLVDALHSR